MRPSTTSTKTPTTTKIINKTIEIAEMIRLLLTWSVYVVTVGLLGYGANWLLLWATKSFTWPVKSRWFKVGLSRISRAPPIKSTPQNSEGIPLTQLKASKPIRATRTIIADRKNRRNWNLWKPSCSENDDIWPFLSSHWRQRRWPFSASEAFSWTGIGCLKSRDSRSRMALGWLVTLWWLKKDMM